MQRLLHMGRQALLPGPHRLMRGRLRYLALAMVILGVLSIMAEIKPAPWSATWSVAMGLLAVGFVVASLDWRRIPGAFAIPFCLAVDLLVAAIMWFNPQHHGVGFVFVMSSAFFGALFSLPVVLAHLGIVALALGGQAVVGGPDSSMAYIALSVVSIVGFLRVLNWALQQEASRATTLQTLLELLPVLKAHGVEKVVRAAVDQLVKVTASDSGMIMLVVPETRMLRTHYLHFERPISQEEEDAWATLEFEVGHGIAGWVAEHREPVLTGDAEADPRAIHVPGTPAAEESLMVVPLISGGTLYGVLRLHREGLNQYTAGDLDLLQLMAAHVADALARAELEERVARTDALTGVYNRHFLNEWSQALVPSDREVSVIMIDCRKFKQINDQYGHLTGDWILQEASRLIRESVRNGDLIVRYGGDEFLVVLRHSGAEQASLVAGRLLDRVERWNHTQPEGRPRLALDVGVDTAPESQWSDLLERADARMYASKRAS